MEQGNQFRDRSVHDRRPGQQGYDGPGYQQQVNHMRSNDFNSGSNQGRRYDNAGNYGTHDHGDNRPGYGYRDASDRGQYGNTAYGNQYYDERDRMRTQRSQQQGDNRYGNDYGSSQLGHHYGSRGTGYQHQGYGGSAQGYRSEYAGAPYGYAGNAPDFGLSGHRQDDASWWDRTRSKVASWFGNSDDRRDYESGVHRGKGPRNYQRSEDRIREDLCDRLSADDRVDASDIEVKVEGTDVILTGKVYDRAEKRRAEDIAESVFGVKHVENRIKIDYDRNQHTDSWSATLGL